MKVLVTGSKGFIGSRLVIALQKLGCQVYEFDKGDLLPEENMDVVYHLAAHVNAYESVFQPIQAKENIDLVFDVLEWMRSGKCKKIVFASSREIYSLVNPYGVSKFCGEMIIQSYAQLYGIEACIVRLSNIYGKGNLSHRFIEKTISLAKKNDDIVIYGGKDKVLNFVHVDDCVEALTEYLWKSGGIDHIASTKSWKLADIAQEIVTLLHSRSKIFYRPNRKGETLEYYPPSSDIPDQLLDHVKALCTHS